MILLGDLVFSRYPEERPGGQHVRVSCGVRVEHIPTGLIAICQSDRSQHRNRTVALHMIECALTDPEFRS